jgi:hypothetical protein
MTKPDWETTHRALLLANGFSPPVGLDVTPEYEPGTDRRAIRRHAARELREIERQKEARDRVFLPGRRR